MVESAHPYEAKARIIEGDEREEKTSSTSECVNKSLKSIQKRFVVKLHPKCNMHPLRPVLAQVWHLLASASLLAPLWTMVRSLRWRNAYPPHVEEEQRLREEMEEFLAQSREKVEGKRKRLEDIQNERVKLARSSADQETVATGEEVEASAIIKLNVGGDTSFMTRRDTLTAIEGSRLSQLFSGRWDKVLPKDRDGRIFLDLDPVQFRALLSWPADTKHMAPGSGQGPPLPAVPLEYQAGFWELCELLCSNKKGNSRSGRDDNVEFESEILSSEDQQRLKTWIQHESCPSKHCTGILRFRATRDGFAPANFHQKCDGKGPTVVSAKSEGGHIFGGYAETARDSSNQYKSCRDSFLFRLSGPGGVGPSQHRIHNFEYGIVCKFLLWTHFWRRI